MLPVLFFGFGHLGCGGTASRIPENDHPASIRSERASALIDRAREHRDAGRILSCLEFYGRAYRLGGAYIGEPIAQEILDVLDGLHLEIVAGNRQTAVPGAPPPHPLQIRLVLDHGGRLTPASGIPVVWRWLAGRGALVGERSTDENGFVTVRVQSIESSDAPRLEVAVAVSHLPVPAPIDQPELDGLISDAMAALGERTARFDFISVRPQHKTRVVILVDEEVLGTLADESLLSDRLTTAFVNRGLKVVGITEIGKSHYQKLEQTLARDDLVAVRTEFFSLCDYVLYGRVQVRRDYENAGGGKWCVARGRVSLYSLHDPEIQGSVDFSDVAGFAGPNQGWIQAAEDCLRKAGELTEQRLVPLAVQRFGG